ncbi:MAG: HAD-IA family hydrolase [Myxococcaceae bacterium]|nr:HAD-IA family hydrolase [Myxococcaceae bacterium]
MRAVLFDMDGVLVRSEEVWFKVVEAAGVRFRGRPVTREEFFPTFGQGTATDIPVFGFSCTVPELDAFYVREFVKHLAAIWVNPEARPLAEQLHARGVRVGVVTNTVAPLTAEILRHARLDELFEVRATADRVEHAKPAPDLVLLALRELGVDASEAVMVGDSRFDREAARAASVPFIGLKLDGDARVERLGDLPVQLGWRQGWRLRPATTGDQRNVEALLTAAGLPLDGVGTQFPGAFVVAEERGVVLGVAALERYGSDGLLRSVAVAADRRGGGVGGALVEERLAEARKAGLVSVSLLTTTARDYFRLKGFAEASRESVSPALAASAEFARACPSTAVHLVWRP